MIKLKKILARLTKKRIKKQEGSNKTNEKGKVTIDTAEMQMIISSYCKQLYTNT